MSYTDERHAQIVLALLKQHGVRKVVASPGATNIPIVGSMQGDPYFEVYSSVDERSAAYFACGLAEESGEIVAISCTGATASRNYLPALTEAYYRKLPILAITSFNGNKLIGNLVPQNIDRSVLPNDAAKLSVQLPIVKDKSDEELCNLLVNKAILEATRNGGGPVHINLTTTYKGTFETKQLPYERMINRISASDVAPEFGSKKVALFLGSHRAFSKSETSVIEEFCERNGAIVLCDHTSGYRGKYRIQAALITSNISKHNSIWSTLKPDLVIHAGEVSGDYPGTRVLMEASDVWRVSEDGEVRDRSGKLKLVVQGSLTEFLSKQRNRNFTTNVLYENWKRVDLELRDSLPEIPFSNPWIAQQLHTKIPEGSYVNLAILNTLRSWNLFELDESISTFANVGGFGIDGCVSSMLGASLVDNEKLYFGVVGDLAFFYDVNAIANRHIGNNVRILIINNGCGTEFNISTHTGSQFGSKSNEFIAAGGHFGSSFDKSSKVSPAEERTTSSLAEAWAEKLGYVYLCADNKRTLLENLDKFVSKKTDSPVILECFTDSDDESMALKLMSSLSKSNKEKWIGVAKKLLPSTATSKIKQILGN
ncbi:thiamine pyrophosphate-binding protein [Vibrio ulleungensis]|uniref:Thiamine pyrophosphate enzyme N-terminal TPP-binding domain-containing protein n=1 Tax=Vibrio ulleungensis TaxID=2807619 RepID=A0ABS2HKR5_9VIBR|nr:thiamine pyrophosphate-binding protein [Vibrio ulleungensis]MBM7037691.1 hypothetical protein [Vibrio ulleungensis]